MSARGPVGWAMILFRFIVATARASAVLADGIATIDTGNAVLVANGVAKGVALTTASGSVGSTSATIELRVAQFEETARSRWRAPALVSGRAAPRGRYIV